MVKVQEEKVLEHLRAEDVRQAPIKFLTTYHICTTTTIMPFVPGLESFVKIAIPLKHPEDTYTFVHTPEYPGEMVSLLVIYSPNISTLSQIIQIVSSCATAPTIKPKPLPDLTTPKPKPKPEEVKKPEENKAEGSSKFVPTHQFSRVYLKQK